MFDLTDHSAKLSSLNPRAEKHGDENVPACDLKFESMVDQDTAESLVPGVARMLFRKPAVGEQQNLLKDEGNLTQLRHPNMAPLKFDIDLPGYTVSIARGMGLAPAIALAGVELKKFTVSGIEGGSVGLMFSVACKPEPDQVAELYTMQQEDVWLTLQPPKQARKPKAAKAEASTTASASAQDNEGDASKAQADAFAEVLQDAPRPVFQAFIFESDDETVWAGVNAIDAAMTAHNDTGENYDADACRELTDAELDHDFPEVGEDEQPTGERTTLRAIVAAMTEPGFVCELTGPIGVTATAPVEASNEPVADDDVDVRPTKLRSVG